MEEFYKGTPWVPLETCDLPLALSCIHRSLHFESAAFQVPLAPKSLCPFALRRQSHPVKQCCIVSDSWHASPRLFSSIGLCGVLAFRSDSNDEVHAQNPSDLTMLGQMCACCVHVCSLLRHGLDTSLSLCFVFSAAVQLSHRRFAISSKLSYVMDAAQASFHFMRQ